LVVSRSKTPATPSEEDAFVTLSATTALIAVSGSLLASGTPRVAINAPGHAPTVGKHWNYTVTVTEGGTQVAAAITEQIVDPIGGVHPVQFGTSKKNITNWRISGIFKDFIIWPADSRGVPLTLRVTVKVGSAKAVSSYPVTPVG
jgi:hypothetical protein